MLAKNISKLTFIFTQAKIKFGTVLMGVDTKNGIDIVSVPFKPRKIAIDHKFKFSISIVAIFKNESTYLDEWINFHLNQGIEHFYLYDNESTDNSCEVIKKYGRDLITITKWPGIYGNGGQTLALAHAIGLYSLESKWMVHIDLDEFVYSTKGSLLLETIEDLEEVSSIVLPWRCFGPSGHQKPPLGNVVDSYLQKADLSKADAKMKYELTRTKTIFIAHKTISAHIHRTITEGKTIESPPQINLNHYITRSSEEFLFKINRAHPWSNNKVLDSWKKKRTDIFIFLEKYNEIDFEIQKAKNK